MSALLKFLRPYLPKLLLAGFIAGLSLGASVGLLATSAWLISMASTRPPVMVLEVAIVAVRFFGLSRGAIRYYARIREHDAALDVQTKLRQSIYRGLAGRKIYELANLRRGEVLQQVVGDSESIQDLWLRVVLPWLAALISGAAGISIINYLAPKTGATLMWIFLATMFILPALSVLLSANASVRAQEAALFDQYLQACESLETALVFGQQEQIKTKLKQAQVSINKIELRQSISAGATDALQAIAAGSSILVAIFGAAHAYTSNHLAGVNIAVLVLVPLAIYDGLPTTFAAFAQVPSLLSRATVLAQYLNASKLDSDESISTLDWSELKLINLVPNTVKGRIAPINAIATPGHPLVITGRSGVGKSSIIYAILGELDYEGTIEFNQGAGTSVLMQSDHLFATSIRENLKISNKQASDADIWQVLELVELDKLIKSLPEQLDTHIAPYGFNFSGGEKQRLKLARALLRAASIYILDEPLEFIDFAQGIRIWEAIARRLATKTLVVVSHLPLQMSDLMSNLRLTD